MGILSLTLNVPAASTVEFPGVPFNSFINASFLDAGAQINLETGAVPFDPLDFSNADASFNDGDFLGLFWNNNQGSVFPRWFGLDLGAPTPVDVIGWHEWDANLTWRVLTPNIDSSNDGVVWNTELTPVNPAGAGPKLFNLPGQVTARYWRWYIPALANTSQALATVFTELFLRQIPPGGLPTMFFDVGVHGTVTQSGNGWVNINSVLAVGTDITVNYIVPGEGPRIDIE